MEFDIIRILCKMKLEVKYSGKFKKGLKLAAKRGLDISSLEEVVEKLRNRIPLAEKYQDHSLIN